LTETFDCVEDGKKEGFVSSGCTKDPQGDHCEITSVADQACADGAAAAQYCENLTDEQLYYAYVNCFQDNMGAHEIVTCFSKYVTKDMKTADDCTNAEMNCLGDATGAGGAGGTP
jgi:hypothetical protein